MLSARARRGSQGRAGETQPTQWPRVAAGCLRAELRHYEHGILMPELGGSSATRFVAELAAKKSSRLVMAFFVSFPCRRGAKRKQYLPSAPRTESNLRPASTKAAVFACPAPARLWVPNRSRHEGRVGPVHTAELRPCCEQQPRFRKQRRELGRSILQDPTLAPPRSRRAAGRSQALQADFIAIRHEHGGGTQGFLLLEVGMEDF